jgi:NADPH-dependent curcumin reductase CurA
MPDILNQRIVMKTRPVGMPTIDDFSFENNAIYLDSLNDGQVLIKVLTLSLDPYMRGRMKAEKSYSAPLQEGEIITGESVGVVVASQSNKYSIGQTVCSMSGWQKYHIANDADIDLYPTFTDDIPLSTYLGVVGMPGRTAYLGFKHKAKPQSGETIVVSAASGAVGAIVGQLAKQQGLTVIGVAGSKEKCEYVKEELGFDHCLSYLDDNFEQLLIDSCPKGIDIYWEGVGGRTLKAVLPLLNKGARVPICGFIANYNDTETLSDTPMHILSALPTPPEHGFFLVSDWFNEYQQATEFLAQSVINGSLKFKESVANGLENSPSAFIGMLSGKNFGKQVVKIADK